MTMFFRMVEPKRIRVWLWFPLSVLLLSVLVTTAAAAADRGEWQPNTSYAVGDMVTYEGGTYECIQAHTSLTGWEPDTTNALWEPVANPDPDPTDEQAPTVPANVQVTATTAHSVDLSWEASTDNVGVDEYTVYNGSSQEGTTSQTSLSVTGLQSETVYTFTVEASDAAGNVSATSDPVQVTTEAISDPNPNPGGTLDGKVLVGYWHNFDNGSTTLTLEDVSSEYDVIQVAFAEPTAAGDGTMQFSPYNVTDAAFKEDIAELQGQGKKVLISIGGANAHVELNTEAEQANFESSMISIIENYGFDGFDIDLEGGSLSLESGDTDFRNPRTPKVVNLIEATQTIVDHFGSDFILTMAPETAYVQGGASSYGGPWGAYLPVIHGLRDELTLLHVQHYNSGSMVGLDGQSYSQGTADFHVAMGEMMLQGFELGNGQMFPGLREDQVAFGVPANANAAGGGYTSPSEVQQAVEYLVTGQSFGGQYQLQNTEGYPAFRGLMTWSINWDAADGYPFAGQHGSFLEGLE